jgi:hypothetical protein
MQSLMGIISELISLTSGVLSEESSLLTSILGFFYVYLSLISFNRSIIAGNFPVILISVASESVIGQPKVSRKA